MQALHLPSSAMPLAVRMTELLHNSDSTARSGNVLCLKRLRGSAEAFKGPKDLLRPWQGAES